MGRIEKALSKVAKESSSHDKDSPVPISGSVDAAADDIDFSKLPNLTPDQECLIKNRIVAAQPDAPARAVYKVLRTRVLQRLRTSNWNVLGVSGTGPGEGKTMTAINLAYSLAQNVNHRVILVDLDLRRPSIHSYLGIAPKHDLTKFLNGSEKLADILVRPGESRLAILTNQTTFRDSSEVLSSPKLVSMIHQLRNLGPKTITVIDLPPILAGDDVLAFSPLIDALLLVVAQGTCRRDHLVQVQELLHDTAILGAVLNRSREKSATSGYYEYY
jgi:protein-tyrosine kinase